MHSKHNLVEENYVPFVVNLHPINCQILHVKYLILQDTGISVRKRVIKIFRDICIEQTDFKKIPEMCVRIIRRVNDEEGIKVSVLNSLCYIVTSEYTTITMPLRDSAPK